MFRRILVPLDGTKRAEEAIPFARELAATSSEARIFLLHVEPPMASVMDEIAIDNRLEVLADELRAAGIKAHIVTEFGKAAPAIATAADLDKIDVIVLAPEPRGLLEGLRHPSVTASVLARTAAPVLVVPPARAAESPQLLRFGGAQVIVTLDGSALAEKALPTALRLARHYDRPLLLLRIVPPVRIIAAGPETYPLVRDSYESEVREATDYLAALRERLERTESVQVQTMFHQGVPAEVILGLAETKPGSILVMSTHGRTGLARLVLGSVTLAVARKSRIPLMIVPTATADAAKSAPVEAGAEA
ncbi:MAG TPA: universal stress protein [Ktedonobacterales bacterium]|jgi:nucleotide-binding universal stress UspA family protein